VLALMLALGSGATAEVVPASRPDSSVAPADWILRAQQHIEAREYHASENGHGLQAPNRAHNLRTRFEKSGIRVHDRTAAGSPELLGLSLAGIGRGAALASAPPGERVVADADRVEIHRPGLVEWYVNSPAGLEQGFTLAERLEGEGPLSLELLVSGAKASLRGDAVVLATSVRRKLRYGALVVVDAEERALASRFEIAGPDRVRIVVDDAGAIYPIVIDPLLTESADTQLEGDQLTARLGDSVASAGDVNGDGYADVIVGARLYDAGQTDEGAAFIFLGSADGVLDGNPASAATQLESNQGASAFGWSVAGAGDVDGDGYADVIVGAPSYDAGESDEGAAFVFHGGASGIADGNPASAATQLESNQEKGVQPAGPNFGESVAGAGDVDGDGYADVIVGAKFYDAGQTDEEAVTNENTLMVFIFSNNPYVQLYERDLVLSMKKGKKALYTIGISENPVKDIDLDMNINLSDSGILIDEELLTVCYVLPGQLLGLFKSIDLGLNPDSPSASGAISRVVENVTIYSY
jgi:hypothetical protein